MARWRQAVELAMTDEEIERLVAGSRSRTEAASRVERAQILLAYRKNPSFFAVGKKLGVHHQTVQRCVERAVAYGPRAALDDRPRPGKEPTITPEARAWLVSLACDKAKQHGYPHELWTTRLLARHARKHGPAAGHWCLANLVQVRSARFSAERKLSRTRCAIIWNVATPSSSRRWRRFCVYREVQILKSIAAKSNKPNQPVAIFLRREAGNPGHRDDGARFAASARRPRDFRA